jgi:hypothetical protein
VQENNSDDELPGAYAFTRNLSESNDEWDPTEQLPSAPIGGRRAERRASRVQQPRTARSYDTDELTDEENMDLPETEVPVETSNKWFTPKCRWLVVLVLLIACGVVGAVVGVLLLTGNDSQPHIEDNDSCESLTDPFLQCKCNQKITLTNYDEEEIYEALRRLYTESWGFDIEVGSCSSENLALAWAAQDSVASRANGSSFSLKNTENRFVLALLYTSWGGDDWTNKENWLADGVGECNWYGVFCNGDQEIKSLSLQENNLHGLLGTH